MSKTAKLQLIKLKNLDILPHNLDILPHNLDILPYRLSIQMSNLIAYYNLFFFNSYFGQNVLFKGKDKPICKLPLPLSLHQKFINT